MGSLMLRPADSPPPLERRLDPAYLNAPVARSRPAGRYTLNRQLAWEAPFILRENERLRWAYAHLRLARLTGGRRGSGAEGEGWGAGPPDYETKPFFFPRAGEGI
jgi:hypothetical protein